MESFLVDVFHINVIIVEKKLNSRFFCWKFLNSSCKRYVTKMMKWVQTDVNHQMNINKQHFE